MGTEQFISCSRTTPVGAIALLQGSDGDVIPVSEVHELPTKIHNIMGSAVS